LAALFKKKKWQNDCARFKDAKHMKHMDELEVCTTVCTKSRNA